MRNLKLLMAVLLLWCLLLGATQTVTADWDDEDGHKMHYPQHPDPYGWDVCLHDQAIADDFKCAESGPITDIHFWVSWTGDDAEWTDTAFEVEIWDDAPNGPCGYGQPGNMRWQWNGQGMKRLGPFYGDQGWHCPSADQSYPNDHKLYWQINIFVTEQEFFEQEEDTKYWLVIRAQKLEWPPAAGWKTTLDTEGFESCTLWLGDDGTGTWKKVLISDELEVNQAFVITGGQQPPEVDFGDAQDAFGAPGYPTLLANNGARHLIGGPWLGDSSDNPDPDPDGQQSPDAKGDDIDILTPLSPNDDEDGVQIPILTQDETETITFEVNGSDGIVVGWIDFDSSGTWEASEQVVAGLYAIGPHSVNITVPSTAAVGQTFARFRIVSTTVTAPGIDGQAPNGEVEDHLVDIEEAVRELDFGDAPEAAVVPGYPTLLPDGARHRIAGPWLGPDDDAPDAEVDGQPTNLADGDDVLDGNDDEDGVTFFNLVPSQNATITFQVNGSGGSGGSWVIGWIDFNADYVWDSTEMVVFGNYSDGVWVESVPVPSSATVGDTYARFRISSYSIDDPDGYVDDGEVEDYKVAIKPPRDYGDAPDSYRTVLASNGPRHELRGPYLGDRFDNPDQDPDGQPNGNATGDDLDILSLPVNDDEDGVQIPTLYIGTISTLTVEVFNVGNGAYVDGWIDFNGNGMFEAGEIVVSTFYTADGSYPVNVTPLTGTVTGQTFARFRINSTHPLGWEGSADDGEVEDHEVIIREPYQGKPAIPNLKWSQPPLEIFDFGIDPPFGPWPIYCGWDELSAKMTDLTGQVHWRAVADDFHCLGKMPVSSIHWWGSHNGWTWHDFPPPNEPQPEKWLITFWMDVPDPFPTDPATYSHPGKCVHKVVVDDVRVDKEIVGLDQFPNKPDDTCYQYYISLNPEEFFWQDDFVSGTNEASIFWISIVALYPEDITSWDIRYPWGWKTRPYHWMDDAVTFTLNEEPQPGTELPPTAYTPIEDESFGIPTSYDVSFELDTLPEYVKWQQPFDGIRIWPHYWDELSWGIEDTDGTVQIMRQVADDWLCLKRTPVTALSWWGSHDGVLLEPCTQLPQQSFVKPAYFMATIWTDQPADSNSGITYSRPRQKIWQYNIHRYDQVLIGYDYNQRTGALESVFHYSARIPESAQFCQNSYEEVYWISIVAIYGYYQDPVHPWGWTNHQHVFNDDAVARNSVTIPPQWQELRISAEESMDMSFILFTDPTECCKCPDYDWSGVVDMFDTATFADNWLWIGPSGGMNDGDLNCNGKVDFFDYSIFADLWLDSCP